MNDRSRFLLGKTPKAPEAPKTNEKLLGRVRKELGFTKAEFDHDDSVRRFVMREYYNRRNAAVRKSRNDIGELPMVAHPERRERCRLDLKAFIEEYFRETGKFDLPWSEMHIDVLRQMQECVLEGGQFAMALPRGTGKALALDAPLPTPTGWTTMGEVRVGDFLLGRDGRPCRVLAKSEVFTDHDCYCVRFSDGEEITCDAGHLWLVEDHSSHRASDVRTCEWLSTRATKTTRGYVERRFRMPSVAAIELPEASLPIPPYSLGVWLGDGNTTAAKVYLNNADAPEIIARMRQEGVPVEKCGYGEEPNCAVYKLTHGGRLRRERHGVHATLREIGLLGDKRIPSEYLRASFSQRLSLFQGLMDTDGGVDKCGHCDIVFKSKGLAEDFCELVSSLGIVHSGPRECMKRCSGKPCGPYWRVYFQSRELPPASLRRHFDRWRESLGRNYGGIRRIESIERVPTVPTQCVMVDSADHLYLAGRRMVPTHNSSMTQRAIIWSLLYGHRKFVVAIGDGKSAASECLETVKSELETNDRLFEDFPETCVPVRALEGISLRGRLFSYHGRQINLSWGSDKLVLPSIPGSPSSGSVLVVTGINSRLRGMKHNTSDGLEIRPDFCFIDDPSSDRSAASPSQNDKRASIINGTVLNLSGPGRKLAAVMCCTIIKKDDLADRLLDRERSPAWNGVRFSLVRQFPKNQDLWNQYEEIWRTSQRLGHGIRDATEFYRNNREAMDEGAVVTWPERYENDELSGLQFAMDRMFRDREAFFSEMQNSPMGEGTSGDEESNLKPADIYAKVNGLSRRVLPVDTERLVISVDVQLGLLVWTAVSASEGGDCHICDYGTYPKQPGNFWSLSQNFVSWHRKGASVEAGLYDALSRLKEEIDGTRFVTEDGQEMRPSRILVDCAWGASTQPAMRFCRELGDGIWLPSFGRGITADKKPFSDYRRQAGMKIGPFWLRTRHVKTLQPIVEVDTNSSKSIARQKIFAPLPGGITVFGRPENAVAHRCLAEQLSSEYSVRTSGRYRDVDVWAMYPGRDNHYWDCLCNCLAALSEQGIDLYGLDKTASKDKPKSKKTVHLPRKA